MCVCVYIYIYIYIYILAAHRETLLCDTYNVGNWRRKMVISTCAFILTEETILTENILIPGSLAPPELATQVVLVPHRTRGTRTLSDRDIRTGDTLPLSEGVLIRKRSAAMGLVSLLGSGKNCPWCWEGWEGPDSLGILLCYAICYTHIYCNAVCK